MWNGAPNDLRTLRLSAEVLDRVDALQRRIAATGGPADDSGKAHPLLRHVRAEMQVYTGLMRLLNLPAVGL